MSQVSDTNGYQNAAQRLQDSFESERSESRANHERDLQKTKGQTETEILSAKKEYNERLESERASARDEVRRLKDELYGQKGKTSANEYRELNEERKRLSSYQDELRSENDRKIQKIEKSADSRAEKNQSQEGNQVERAVEAQKKSARQEVRALEEELSQYRTEGRDVSAEKAKAKQETIAENEGSQISERNRIIEGYERQIEKLKGHQGELQDHFDRRLNEAAFENSAKTRDQLVRQKSEFIEESRNAGQKQVFVENNYKTEIKNEQDRQAQAANNLIAKNSADLESAVAAKDQAYQSYLADHGKQDDYQLKTRDEKIKELETTSDPLKISPYAVKRINDAAEKRYYGQLNEANHVNTLNLNAVRDRDVADRQDLSKEYQAKFTGVTRGVQKELDVKDKLFLNSYDDLSHLHQSKEAALVQQKQEVVERLYQKQALELVDAQNQKKEALEEQRDALHYEKTSAVDDSDQARRLQEREWSLKTNDLRRNLETQMTEERDQHQKVVGELKLEFDKKLRDQDRVSKRSIDERVRSFEHQIKQQELSFREKERFLTEHYEEELDSMKRTNAHLTQKKS